MGETMTPSAAVAINCVPVSVVIPCYRCSGTIQRAVESVIAQTRPPKEIILIDDFSNDGQETVNALNLLHEKYQDVSIKILLLNKNCGPGNARNAGWNVSSQPYLAFLDADDCWHPMKLEIQYEWMDAHPDVALSGHLSSKIVVGGAFPDLPNEINSQPVNKNKLLYKNCLPTRSVMLKREVPYKFTPEKRYAEDYLLWLTMVFNGYQANILPAALAFSFKEDFGDGGLTGNLWKTELGVIDTYQRLYNLGFISTFTLFLVITFSFLKYIRRYSIVKFRFLLNSI
jgi:glycosyltransferase involved in cell wall biosynthesis